MVVTDYCSDDIALFDSASNSFIILNRILNKFLDNYQEDLLPWHESIEPCLSSMTAFVSDREVLFFILHYKII